MYNNIIHFLLLVSLSLLSFHSAQASASPSRRSASLWKSRLPSAPLPRANRQPEASAPPAPGTGYTLATCFVNSECVGGRLCLRAADSQPGQELECNNADICTCRFEGELTECENCRNCLYYPNETCIKSTDAPNSQGLCLSILILDTVERSVETGCNTTRSTSPTPSPTVSHSISSSPSPSPLPSSGVCVDAALLHDAHRKGRTIFPTHRKATVLCDPSGSCATPGHIVVFDRRVMTMKSYCAVLLSRNNHQQLGALSVNENENENGSVCTQRSMLVNSPRYEAKLRIDTHTPGLQFTALSARHETKLEELFLRAAVNMGM